MNPSKFCGKRNGVGLGVAVFACVLSAGISLPAQTISNPSFETDAFSVSPGYVSGNAPITGWTGSDASRVGLNPAGGQSPFANNGVIPDGTQVAFVQSAGPVVFSTVMTGLTPSEVYKVRFRANGRNGQSPNLKIAVDGQFITSLIVPSVGGSNPYRYVAFDFTAAAASQTLYLTNDAAGDHTLLVDDFSIAPSTTGWSYQGWSNDGDSGIDGTKNYTHAYNFGGSTTTTDTTINGVLFKAVLGANPGIPYEFGLESFGIGFTGTDGNAITVAGGGSAALMRQFAYSANPGTINLAGLVPGMEYVLTLYSVGWEAGVRGLTFNVGDDYLTVNQDHFGNDQGIRISYHYIAPADGKISVQVTPFVAASTFHFYGLSNYEVGPQADPVIGLQPQNLVGAVGFPANFTVTAGGERPLSYQWQKDEMDLRDQTNRVLMLASAVSGDAGDYRVIVANANNSITSQVATLSFDGIPNPSFEADTFLVWPGYISGSGPISGWAASDPARAGINPLPGYAGPFANNGIIPDGTQAAFLQSVVGSPKTLATVIGGLTGGQTYTLTFRANARAGQVPAMHAAIDGVSALDFRLGSVGDAPYKYVAFDFTPSTTSASLTFTNDAGADTAALLDDFEIAPSTTEWSFAEWSDDATSGVDGSKNYSHAYNFNSSSSPVINGVTFQGISGANPAVAGAFGTVGLNQAFASDANTITANAEATAALASDFVYGGVPQSITLSNLVPGVEYVATIYSVGFDGAGRGYGRAATFSVGNDRQTINQDHFGDNAGIRVSYHYVADLSGTITLEYSATHNFGGTPSTIHTYGFSNYEVSSTNAPVFYQQPRSRTVAGGSTVTFVTAVGGEQPLTLQWQKDGMDLVGENGATLTLANVNGGNSGVYTLVASNAHGVVISSDAVLEVGLLMANPSFEVDTFTNSPGYISGNFPITGWTDTVATGTGINPIENGNSPFADNGVIPDGQQVAFIQADGGMLSQVVTGMTAGATYYLKFYENARGGARPLPSLAVTLGGNTVVPEHVVGAGAYVQVVSGPFLATTDSAELVFIKTPGPTGGDSTVLIDNVAVLDLPPSQPDFLVQPEGAYRKEGDNYDLVSLAQGTLPMSYQWQHDDVDVAGANDSTLSLINLMPGDAGSYQVIASNQYGMATSMVAVVQVGVGIAEMFNTGVDDAGGLLIGGAVDPHYALTSSADPIATGPNTFVLYDAYPIPPYASNGPVSKWIAPKVNDSNNVDQSAMAVLNGLYTYRTEFLLDTLDPATAAIFGKWGMDNAGLDILLNGVSLGLTNNIGFTSLSQFTITNGFQLGINSLVFVISNAPPPGPSAFRAELYGLAMRLPPGDAEILEDPQDLSVTETEDARFSVVAAGGGPLSYQWYFESPLLPGEFFDLSGETNRFLVLQNVAGEQEGNYRAVVTNPSGSVTSMVASLTINRRPVAGDDTIGTSMDLSVTVPIYKLLENDSDPDNDPLSLSGVSVNSTNGGTVVIDGTNVVYTPMTGYTGDDLFTYTLSDGRGGTASGNVQVLVGTTDLLTISSPPEYGMDGHFRVQYSGVPNYLYTVERATDVAGPWELFGEIRADSNGLFEIDDPNNPPEPMRFYRVAYP